MDGPTATAFVAEGRIKECTLDALSRGWSGEFRSNSFSILFARLSSNSDGKQGGPGGPACSWGPSKSFVALLPAFVLPPVSWAARSLEPMTLSCRKCDEQTRKEELFVHHDGSPADDLQMPWMQLGPTQLALDLLSLRCCRQTQVENTEDRTGHRAVGVLLFPYCDRRLRDHHRLRRHSLMPSCCLGGPPAPAAQQGCRRRCLCCP